RTAPQAAAAVAAAAGRRRDGRLRLAGGAASLRARQRAAACLAFHRLRVARGRSDEGLRRRSLRTVGAHQSGLAATDHRLATYRRGSFNGLAATVILDSTLSSRYDN